MDSLSKLMILLKVAMYYKPFNIGITNDSSVYLAARLKQRIRVIVTPSYQWYGRPAGGVSSIGSFTFGNETPAFVSTPC